HGRHRRNPPGPAHGNGVPAEPDAHGRQRRCAGTLTLFLHFDLRTTGMTRPIRTLALTLAAACGLLACATLDEATADLRPYGQQLNERIEQWERWCRSKKLAPNNDNPRRAHIASCDFLFLKDKRWDPNADEFSRYAHSIKLPPPHDQPQAVYRPGMSSRHSVEELCAKEAGEWIFKLVDGVDGVLQARPFVPARRGLTPLMAASAEP